MPRQIESDGRSGPRYLAAFDVRAEWDEPGGAHILSEGTTENVGPDGTLVHLPRKLPDVGSRVRLEVQSGDGKKLQVIAEVLRIERNPGHPLAALQLLGETDEWRGMIWEAASPRVTVMRAVDEESDNDDEAEDEEETAT